MSVNETNKCFPVLYQCPESLDAESVVNHRQSPSNGKIDREDPPKVRWSEDDETPVDRLGSFRRRSQRDTRSSHAPGHRCTGDFLPGTSEPYFETE